MHFAKALAEIVPTYASSRYRTDLTELFDHDPLRALQGVQNFVERGPEALRAVAADSTLREKTSEAIQRGRDLEGPEQEYYLEQVELSPELRTLAQDVATLRAHDDLDATRIKIKAAVNLVLDPKFGNLTWLWKKEILQALGYKKHDRTGVTVSENLENYLQTLDTDELQATFKNLSKAIESRQVLKNTLLPAFLGACLVTLQVKPGTPFHDNRFIAEHLNDLLAPYFFSYYVARKSDDARSLYSAVKNVGLIGGIGWECLQGTPLFPGGFDPLDVVAAVLGIGLGLAAVKLIDRQHLLAVKRAKAFLRSPLTTGVQGKHR